MDDIQTGKMDKQIETDFASPPPKSNGTASPQTQPFAFPPDTVPESDEDVGVKPPSPIDEVSFDVYLIMVSPLPCFDGLGSRRIWI